MARLTLIDAVFPERIPVLEIEMSTYYSVKYCKYPHSLSSFGNSAMCYLLEVEVVALNYVIGCQFHFLQAGHPKRILNVSLQEFFWAVLLCFAPTHILTL